MLKKLFALACCALPFTGLAQYNTNAPAVNTNSGWGYVTNVSSVNTNTLFTHRYVTNAPGITTNAFGGYVTNQAAQNTNAFGGYSSSLPQRYFVVTLSTNFITLYNATNTGSGGSFTSTLMKGYYYDAAASTNGMIVYTNTTAAYGGALAYLVYNDPAWTNSNNSGASANGPVWDFGQYYPDPQANNYNTTNTSPFSQWFLFGNTKNLIFGAPNLTTTSSTNYP